MELKTWNSNLVTFLSHENTVIVHPEELTEFIQLMAKVGLDASSLRRVVNREPLIVEYDNSKGFTYWNEDWVSLQQTINNSVEWFGIEPFTLEEIML